MHTSGISGIQVLALLRYAYLINKMCQFTRSRFLIFCDFWLLNESFGSASLCVLSFFYFSGFNFWLAVMGQSKIDLYRIKVNIFWDDGIISSNT